MDGSFAAVTGPQNLWPGMSTDDARRALAETKIPAGEHTGNSKPPHWLNAERDGWHGTLYLGDYDRVVSSLLFISPDLSNEHAARTIVDDYLRRYGSPTGQRHVDGADGTWKDTFYDWKNTSAHLEITLREESPPSSGASRKWTVFEKWTTPDK